MANDSVIIYLFSPGFSKLLTPSLALAQTLALCYSASVWDIYSRVRYWKVTVYQGVSTWWEMSGF